MFNLLIVGLIDGTLVAMRRPPAQGDGQVYNAFNYFSHKGYYALNTLIVSIIPQPTIIVIYTPSMHILHLCVL